MIELSYGTKKLSSKNRNNEIVIKGARVNNLKKHQYKYSAKQICCGYRAFRSGKSSLAFDTILCGGKPQVYGGISSYARNFLDPSIKPDVDKIENLSPPISIDQKSISRSPRSTVGTLTEVYDYLRILFAKVGVIHCPSCGTSMPKKEVKRKYLMRFIVFRIARRLFFWQSLRKLHPAGKYSNIYSRWDMREFA